MSPLFKSLVTNTESEMDLYDRNCRRIFACINDGIWMIAMNGKTVLATTRFEEMLGYLPNELNLSSFNELVCPRALAATLTGLVGNGADLIESQLVKKGGSSIPVTLKCKAAFDGLGAQEGWLIVVTDVSEKRRLEEKLRQSQKVEALGQLAAGIAHDFNNFLGIILMESEGLLENLATDANVELREGLQAIRGVSERAASLTKQLLSFSRSCEKSLQPMNLSATVLEMERLMTRLIGENISLTTELAPHLGCVRIDGGQLQQVIMNLVVNARDAMPNGGNLWIKTKNIELDSKAAAALNLPKGAYITLTVRDTGQGMTKETTDHIFDHFFTTKEAGKGTGLGLATVQEIVKQSFGAITVKSKIGEGSTFQILFPRVHAPEVKPIEIVDSGAHRGSETVLLLEDDPALRKATGSVLRRNGYEVLEASNGRDALSRFGKNLEGIDLIITDVVMPEMSGPEFIQAVTHALTRKNIPVLFLSGYADSKLHAAEFPENLSRMTKPVRSKALLQKAHEMLLLRHTVA